MIIFSSFPHHDHDRLLCVGSDLAKDFDLFLLLRALEGERQIVVQFGGFFHGSCFRRFGFIFPPDAGECGLDFLLEAGD